MDNIQQSTKYRYMVTGANWYTVCGWMIMPKELGGLELRGIELHIFAVIYGFSQTKNTTYTGSLQYLAEWCQSTTRHVIRCLQSLQDKQLIFKDVCIGNNVRVCTYRANMNEVQRAIKNVSSNNVDDCSQIQYKIEDEQNVNTCDIMSSGVTSDIDAGDNKMLIHVTSGHMPADLRSHDNDLRSHNNIDNNIEYNIDKTIPYNKLYSIVSPETDTAVPAPSSSILDSFNNSDESPLFTRQRKSVVAENLMERVQNAPKSIKIENRVGGRAGVRGDEPCDGETTSRRERKEDAMRKAFAEKFIQSVNAIENINLMQPETKEYGQKIYDWLYSCAHKYQFKLSAPTINSLWEELKRYERDYGLGTLIKVLQKATANASVIYSSMFNEFKMSTNDTANYKGKHFNEVGPSTPEQKKISEIINKRSNECF